MSELLDWYADHGRHDLPWRTTDDPYHVYISEVMLQQTQVKTVLDRYYFPFLERFPSLRDLADAPRDAVLKAWEGLGYYSRAANLHSAATITAPALPATLEGLLALPGVGRNTAHAVLALGFHQPFPVMEANVKRVLCRLYALEAPSDTQLWEKAWERLDDAHPFDYNQAMMDLGAMICTPRAPLCLSCPLARECRGKTAPERYPTKKAKKAVPVRQSRLVIAVNPHAEVWLAPRETRLLGGLHAFPQVEATTTTVTVGDMVLSLKNAELLGRVTHIYSHFRLEAEVVRIACPHGEGPHWHSRHALESLALSKVDRKAAALMA